MLYGGARGGGKTDALLAKAIGRSMTRPGSQTLMLRRTFADLNEPMAAIPRSHELLWGRWQWDGQNHRWLAIDPKTKRANGSIVQFGHMKDLNAMRKYQGAQVDLLEWDELTQFLEEQFNFVSASVRATIPGESPQICAGTNPGGIGHGWVRKRIVDMAPWGQPFDLLQPDTGKTIMDPVTGHSLQGIFIPAKVDDNPALLARDPGYKYRLELLDEQLRKAWLDGSWDVFAGQYFTEWRRDVHVCTPFNIPPEWPRWRCVDYGFHAPMCCLWLARSPDKQIFVYRELYETNLRDDEQAVHIASRSANERILMTVGDPSMWNHDGGSIAQTYAARGVPIIKANNDRRAGWQRVHQVLSDEPVLQVFETCQNLIRTLPALVYDQHDVEDVDTDGEDHAPDALRYGLMASQQFQRPAGGVTSYGYGR